MKKNKMLIALVGILAAVAIAVGGFLIWGNRGTKEVNEPSVDWYDSETKEFTITTVEELYGLAILSEQYDFGGQTVRLGADITVNSGKASSWAKQPPVNVWTPVTGFAGTFDGQGHTISGIYAVGINSSVGLFTDTKASANIKNLSLENSFIKGMSDKGTGSIIGSGAGTLENIYSNAIVECQSSNCGGLVGFMREGKTNLIQNCWFDGSVQGTSGTSSYVGGIVGKVLSNSGIPKIAHCLNTADVSAKSEYAGGFVGAVVGESSLWIVDSLSLGDVQANEGTSKVGMAVGSVFSQATLNLQTTWVAEGKYDSKVGEALGKVKGVCGARSADMLQDTSAYTYTTLDFDNYWAARKNKTPVLQSFSKEKLNLADAEKLIDVSWFDETATTLHIKDEAQFYGFQFLSQAYSFSGQFLLLDEDLTLNSGDAKTWEKNAPEHEWAPIGRHVDEDGKTIGVVFAGTFDGQGHTISGLYMGVDSTKAFAYGMFGKTSGTIKNLSLKNSYIGGTAGGNVGSVAGSFAGGKMESVYSDAIVHMQANHVGGLVGRDESTAKFTNCWFDGDVIGNERVGGIMGSMNNNTTLEIYHCLNSGKIHANSYYAGGLSGLISNGTGIIEDSLNVGMISTDKGAGWSGGITGVVNGKAGIGVKATLKDVYTMMGTYKQMYGMNGEEHTITGPGGVVLKKEELTGRNAYLWTSLNFEEYWTVTAKGTPILKTFAEEIIPVSGGRWADATWYSVQGKTFNINSPAELRGLMLLSRTNDFKGQTFNLTQSFSIGARNWEPIGTHVENSGKTLGKAFAGTFDGNGNQLSGLTMNLQGKEVAYGLFGQVSGTVKNLSLTDGKITGTATSAVGTVAGALRGNGKLENIYNNVQVNVAANYVGGIVGKIEKDSTCTITNCWNDGEVSGKERVAGIVGYATSGANLSISHCLNTQKIYATSTHYTAGICGLADQCTIEITDCLNTDAITCPEDQKLGYSGAILGAVNGTADAKGKSTINHAYYLASSCTKGSNVIAANAEHITADGIGAISVTQPRLTGKAALQWTTLDYVNYWSLVEDGTPVLASFIENPTMSDYMVDISWYDAGEENLTIMDKGQLLGLRLLSQSVDFAGKTVTLGADIDLAEESWLPIGLHVDSDGTTIGVAFAGTFDGNGKSITGMNAAPSDKAGSWGLFGQIAGTVKNLTVSGTIEGAASQVGGVTGALRSGAKLENVTSNVNLTITGTNVGGITGRVENAGDYTITNCTYDGTLSATGDNVGGILGNVHKAGKLTISNCTTTAGTKVSGAGAVGGIIGNANNDNDITITNAANSAVVKGTGNNVGGIVGYNGKTALKIQGSVNNGAVSGVDQVGGILAQNNHADTSVISCTNNGAVSGTGSNIGGIVGYNGKVSINVRDCTNNGAASGVASIGGILGYANNGTDGTTKISDCRNTATITGTSNGVGGIAGKFDTNAKSVITNCWNDGAIFGNERIAGIVGLAAKGADLKIAHCLNTKQINTVSTHYAAGICGLVDQGTVEITDCLNVGTIVCTTEGKNLGYSGAILGAVNGSAASKGKATVSNAFYLSSSCTKGTNVIAGNAAYITMDGIGAFSVTASDLTGANASQSTTLDFANYWSLVENGTPVLAYFIDNPVMSDFTVDISWYDAGKDNFTITNKAQLLGLRLLSQSVTFAGKTITLGADIDLAEVNWMPIGTSTTPFAGTFDGNHKTISNMSLTTEGNGGFFAYLSGTVKNLTVSGSITSTGGVTGGIAANIKPGASLHNVTSNVDISHTAGSNNGGVVGLILDKGTYTIENCSYNGTFTGSTSNNVGGILGNANGKGSTITITGCSVTGSISAQAQVGGLIGDTHNTNTIVISGCSNSAAVTGTGNNVGGLIGKKGTSSLTISDTTNTGTWYSDTAITFTISSVDELLQFAELAKTNTFAGKTVNIVTNIDLTGIEWMPIGTSDTPFAGTFNGNNKTISNMSLTTAGNGGFFAYLSGTVQNLTVSGSITSKGTFTGGIAANIKSGAELSNVTSNVDITHTAGGNSGGIVGVILDKGTYTIENCSYNGNFTGSKSDNVGGILGNANGKGSTITITGCSVSGSISAKAQVGGLIGNAHNTNTIVITGCTNSAAVTGTGNSVGGLVGANGTSSLTIQNSQNNGAVTGRAVGAGGILGGFNTGGSVTVSATTNSGAWHNANATTFTISTVDELLQFVELVNVENNDFAGKTVNLAANIDLTGIEWTPIGLHVNASGSPVGKAFAGTFNGNGKSITGMNAAPSDKAGSWGFFGQIAGTVKNLTVSGTIEGAANQVGGVTAALRKGAKLENVTSNVNITITGTNVGGITGRVEQAGDYTISGCSYGGTLSATGNNVGGIVGDVYKAGKLTIINCATTSNANVSGAGAVGGIIGNTNNSNTVSVTGCNNNAVVSGTGNNVGGIVGYNGTTKLTISGCNNNTGATITGVKQVGGILGQAAATNHTEKSPATGITIAPDVTISGCKNYGQVNGTSDYVGGIIGLSNRCALLIENSYNGGIVTSTKTTIGAIAGYLDGVAASRGYITFNGVTYLTGTCNQAYTVNATNQTAGHIDLNVDDCIEVAADGNPVIATPTSIEPITEEEPLPENEEEKETVDTEVESGV